MTDVANPLEVEQDTLEAQTYRSALDVIGAVEPRVADAIRSEINDQRSYLKLIASENYASPAVLLTMGTWFSDKYAEGTVGHRFYAGCQNVDTVEQLASDLACEVFGAPYAYVQPHSGIDANLVAFWAMLAARVEEEAVGGDSTARIFGLGKFRPECAVSPCVVAHGGVYAFVFLILYGRSF